MHRIDVHKLADESKFNRFHALVLFWGVLILILDGYDLAVVGAALPSIMKDMGVDATQAGFMASSALFGMMFGAIFLGTLADKIGRPLMISICVALFSVFTAAAGLTHDPVTFSITRFLAGLGIGGVLPIVTAQMAEFAPVRMRARLVTLVFAGYSVGGILVALTGKQLIETYGWQSVFFAALAPVAADSVHHEDDAGVDAVPDQEEPRRRTAPDRQEARAELSVAGARAVHGAGRGHAPRARPWRSCSTTAAASAR